jgi:cobalamin biosynthesis protein CobD/CbiB
MVGISSHHHPHVSRHPLDAAVGLFWFFLTVGLAMTVSLALLGGPEILAGAALRTATIVAVVLLAAHSWRQYCHRAEPLDDERLRHARERRGF